MKLLCALIVTVTFSGVFNLAAEDKVKRRVGRVPFPAYSVKTELKGKLEWKLGGATLTFKQEGKSVTLEGQDGAVVSKFPEPFKITGAIQSEGGEVLLVAVMKEGFHTEVRRIRVNKEGKISVDNVMNRDHKNISIRRRWVRELGAVSDDGSRAILHIGEFEKDQTEEHKGGRMYYGWQTWNLETTKKLSDGLKMENAK